MSSCRATSRCVRPSGPPTSSAGSPPRRRFSRSPRSGGPTAAWRPATCFPPASWSGGQLLQRLHVDFLHPEDRVVAAEQDDPAVLTLDVVDVLVRLLDCLAFFSVDHPVRSHG